MAEFRLFKVCLFLMLPFRVTQQYTKLHTGVGAEVTLPCKNGKYFHGRCSSIDWIFSDAGRRTTVTLTKHRQIQSEARGHSHRLSVTADCSLVIKKLTAEDEGRYTCRRFRSEQTFTDSEVDLFIIKVGTSPSGSSITVRVGDTATLPCKDGKDFHYKYRSTIWLFISSGNIVTLFEHGQIHREAGSKSLRLSLTADCSLVIKKVTAEDEGLYTCRQFRSGQVVTDSDVHLSVMNGVDTTKATTTPATASTTKSPKTTKTTITTTTTADVPKSTSATSATAGTAASSVTTRSSITSKTKPTTEGAKNTNTVQTALPVLAVGFAVLFIIMAVIGWKRAKRNRTQRSADHADSADGVSYATISHPNKTNNKAQANLAEGVFYASIKKTKKKTWVHNKHHEGDAVTYDTVNISFTSTRASSDDNSIYANTECI